MATRILPMLASDCDEKKRRYPCLVQPKVDGVRGLFIDPDKGMVGRSLKPHANEYTTKRFSAPEFYGIDGELIAEAQNHPDLCRLTTSAVSTIKGEPAVSWVVFDLINDYTIGLPYEQRLEQLTLKVDAMHSQGRWPDVQVIQSFVVNDLESYNKLKDWILGSNYEGTIIRDIQGAYKSGRSTVKEGGLLRDKGFTEGEFYVTGIREGMRNENEATEDPRGYTERSSHAENMIPNGMVGALEGTDAITGQAIVVSAGCMTHAERLQYFQQPALIIGKLAKYKYFAKGVKDLPRFPTFQSLRAESDYK
jgi:DNA ligase-1